ncbi:hypothetical protein BDR26DRAFT_848725 [Obelidium mucronatum]|nr:hypothetical protein BDR26DRAFT_848703 [Obelidium mucronatum]KAI9353517.1 hypothetical protein BDR26DRAFT_848714 [Obelidium mucronatum]KAI9353521.1 hypothetical protein BDR26DRAFT_848725 [Obelidium mucronatum]
MPIAFTRSLSLPVASSGSKPKGITKMKAFWSTGSKDSKPQSSSDSLLTSPSSKRKTPPPANTKPDQHPNTDARSSHDTNPLVKPDRTRLSVSLDSDIKTEGRLKAFLKSPAFQKSRSMVDDSELFSEGRSNKDLLREKRYSLQDLTTSAKAKATLEVKKAMKGFASEYKRKYLAQISYEKLEKKRPLYQQLLVANLIVDFLV